MIFGQENVYTRVMGKKEFDPAKKLSDKDAKELIHDIRMHCGTKFSLHAEERIEERGFTSRDVLYILSHGVIINSEYNAKAANWKYMLEGHGIDGEEGIVITAIISSSTQMIITVE